MGVGATSSSGDLPHSKNDKSHNRRLYVSVPSVLAITRVVLIFGCLPYLGLRNTGLTIRSTLRKVTAGNSAQPSSWPSSGPSSSPSASPSSTRTSSPSSSPSPSPSSSPSDGGLEHRTSLTAPPLDLDSELHKYPHLLRAFVSPPLNRTLFLFTVCARRARWDGVNLTVTQARLSDDRGGKDLAAEVTWWSTHERPPRSSTSASSVIIDRSPDARSAAASSSTSRRQRWTVREGRRLRCRAMGVTNWGFTQYHVDCPLPPPAIRLETEEENGERRSYYRADLRLTLAGSFLESYENVRVEDVVPAAPGTVLKACTMEGAPGREDPGRLLRWLAYHRSVGVDEFTVYWRGRWPDGEGSPFFNVTEEEMTQGSENSMVERSSNRSSTSSDFNYDVPEALRELRRWVDNGVLEIKPWVHSFGMNRENPRWRSSEDVGPELGGQECAGDMPAFTDCVLHARARGVPWIAVIQHDEYLRPRRPAADLRSLLRSEPDDVAVLGYLSNEWDMREYENANLFASGAAFPRATLLGDDDHQNDFPLWGYLYRPNALPGGVSSQVPLKSRTTGQWRQRILDPETELLVDHFLRHPRARNGTLAFNVSTGPVDFHAELNKERTVQYESAVPNTYIWDAMMSDYAPCINAALSSGGVDAKLSKGMPNCPSFPVPRAVAEPKSE